MNIRLRVGAGVAACLVIAAPFASAERARAKTGSSKKAASAYKAPRAPDGHADLEGVWFAKPQGPAYDIERHEQVFGIAGGASVIIDPKDGKIPYQPWAAERKKELFAKHMYNDPEAHCHPSGVPRQVYAPFGFQIFQPPGYVVIAYENFHTYRIIPLDGRPHAPASIKLYEGDSRGHWEGDTLVVDVTNLNDKTWFDMAGNFHSDALHVVERYTRTADDNIHYQATMEDPKTYTRPWTIAFDIRREKRPNYELMELACVEGEQDLKHYVESEGGKTK
jgi:hypothetical protein